MLLYMGFSRPNVSAEGEVDAFRQWGAEEHNDPVVESDLPEGV